MMQNLLFLVVLLIVFVSSVLSFRPVTRISRVSASHLGPDHRSNWKEDESAKVIGSGLFGATSAETTYERCNIYAEMLKSPRWGGFIGPLVRKEELMKHVWYRPKGRGLLTVSNHMSVMDDPGLWSAVLPWWRMRPEQMRWSVCTDDVFFALKGRLAPMFGGGNVIPLDRTGSLDQPLFERFHERLDKGSWCHIFAEGRVWQSWRFDDDQPHLGKFKYGVGKLVAHSKESPIVVPVYHRGMDDVVPEHRLTGNARVKRPSYPVTIFPKHGKDIKMYFGDALDFSQELTDFRERHPGLLDQWKSTPESIDLYMSITEKIRLSVLSLEAQAWGREQGRVSSSSSSSSSHSRPASSPDDAAAPAPAPAPTPPPAAAAAAAAVAPTAASAPKQSFAPWTQTKAPDADDDESAAAAAASAVAESQSNTTPTPGLSADSRKTFAPWQKD